jgi:ABC-type amino acid transport substrate-binding protein
MLAKALAILLLIVAPASADPDRVLRAGLNDDPPLAIKNGGQWSGISVDLLRAIATEMGAKLEIVELTPQQIVSGPLPDVDVVATLVVSEKMNARFDLSHTFLPTGLAIATREPTKESVLAMLGRIFTGSFVLIILAVFALLTLVGLLMWRFEKRHPTKEPPKEQGPLSKALFWALEPMTGYQASQHSSRAGRLLGTVWGLFGVILISGLTANLAAQLTARRMDTAVKGPDDLPKIAVGVVEHTAGSRFCDRRGIRRKEFPTVEAALAAVEQGKIAAVVAAEPALKYALASAHDTLVILPGTFFGVNLAFGLRPDSPIRKDFNAALVKATYADSWTSTLVSYLGKAE